MAGPLLLTTQRVRGRLCELVLLASGLLNSVLMTDVALSILALIAGGLTLELFTVARPPLALRDQRGFSLSAERHETLEEFQAGNPS